MRNNPDGESSYQHSLAIINNKAVKTALKQQKDLSALSRHPLAALRIVDQRMLQKHRESDTNGRGLSLREILLEAIDLLKPEGEKFNEKSERWRSYIV